MFNKKRTRMFKQKLLCHLVQSFLLLALPVSLQAATPPAQEFWDYLNDFSDENGEVVDPLDIDQALNLREESQVESDGDQHSSSEKQAGENPRNKSSVTASSKAMNGAKL